jgi:ribosome assembly protein 4
VDPLTKPKDALVNVNIEEEKERKANGEEEPDKATTVSGSQEVII